MGSLLDSVLGKLIAGLLISAGSAGVSFFVGANGKVPEARVEAVRGQRTEMSMLLEFMADHCPPVPLPTVSEGTAKRLPDNVQALLPEAK